MSLTTYKRKRSFDITPEPVGGKSKGKELRFVIQKHAASHLHYDFRLEMEGVMKSWAIPKGPSSDPEIKRLAMMVEDHPYDYRNFEGIIPKGQYGGGTVIIWDEGTYEPSEGEFASKAEQEKHLLSQLKKGSLKFTMHGKKVKGNYVLVRASYRGENSWLLMKVDDKYAKSTDLTKKDKSVVSGLTVEQVAESSTNIYGQSPKKSAVKKTVAKKAAPKKAVTTPVKKKSAKKSNRRIRKA